MPHAKRRLSALAALAAIVAGCGLPAPATVSDTTTAPSYGVLQAQPGAQQQQQPTLTEIFPFLAGIGLTAAQTSRIQAVLSQQKPVVSQEEAQARAERLLQLLASRQLAKEALRAYFMQSEETSRKEAASAVAMFGAIRNVLTPKQRLLAAAKIRQELEKAKQQAAQPDTATAQGTTEGQGQQQQLDLELTAQQQKAFAAMAPAQASEDTPTALAKFLESGDRQALLSAMVGAETVAARVQKTVAAYAGLTFAQRQKLVAYSRQQQQQAQQQQQQGQAPQQEPDMEMGME